MAKRLADVIEQRIKDEHLSDGIIISNPREVAEDLEAELQVQFLILPRQIQGKAPPSSSSSSGSCS